MKYRYISLFFITMILIGCASSRSDTRHWLDVSIENTIEAYEEFLKKYPKSMYASLAKDKIETLYLQKAIEINTIEAYEEFLRNFSDGMSHKHFQNIYEAQSKLEFLYFQPVKKKNTRKAYQEFLAKFSVGKYAEEARLKIEEMDFDSAISKNTIEAFEHFLEKYPKGKNLIEARQKLEELYWQKVCNENTIEAYKNFLNRFKKGKFVERAGSNVEKLEYEKALKINTIEAIQKFLNDYPDSYLAPYNAQRKLEELHLERANRINTVEAYLEFLEQFPDGFFNSEAKSKIVKLKKIRVVQLVVKENYDNAKSFTLPIEEITRKLLNATNQLRIVGNNAKTADATLTINCTGHAFGADYLNIGFVWSDGEIEGNITFEASKIELYNEFFQGKLHYDAVPMGMPADDPNDLSKIPTLLKQTFTDSDFIRKLAKMIEVLYGSNVAVRGLLKVLTDIENAADALLIIKNNLGLEALINIAKNSKNKNKRSKAVSVLREIKYKKEAVVDALIVILKNDKVWHIRRDAALGIYSFADRHMMKSVLKRAAKQLVYSLENDSNSKVRKFSAMRLEDFRGGIIETEFRNSLKEGSVSERREAAHVLGHIGRREAAEALIAALKNDEDYKVRGNSAQALGKLANIEYVYVDVFPLIDALKDSSPFVRIRVVRALGELGYSNAAEAVEPLMAVYSKDKNRSVRLEAKKILKKFGIYGFR